MYGPNETDREQQSLLLLAHNAHGQTDILYPSKQTDNNTIWTTTKIMTCFHCKTEDTLLITV